MVIEQLVLLIKLIHSSFKKEIVSVKFQRELIC